MKDFTLPPFVVEALGRVARIGVRAAAKAVESVLEDVGDAARDVGDVANNVAKKTDRAKQGLGAIPRERERRPTRERPNDWDQ
jgi:hypothetical protein